MTTLYKLTNQDGFTKNGIEWQVGVLNSLPPCNNPQLCSGDVFHAYTNLNLGLLLNPIHADIFNPRLFECEGEIVISDWGKVGCFDLIVVKELSLPQWYNDKDTCKQVVVLFSILCAESVLSVYENMYPNDDRPRKAIEAAKEYLNNPDHAYDAARAAARAARAAARAAYADADAAARAAAAAAAAAADADADAAAARAAAAAADAADAARAAYADADAAAARAAAAAARADAEIDFGRLADLAINAIVNK